MASRAVETKRLTFLGNGKMFEESSVMAAFSTASNTSCQYDPNCFGCRNIYIVHSLGISMPCLTTQGSLLRRSRTRKPVPEAGLSLPKPHCQCDVRAVACPSRMRTLSLSCPGSLSNSSRASSLYYCVRTTIFNLTHRHRRYLERNSKPSIPYAVSLDIRQIKRRIERLTTFG